MLKRTEITASVNIAEVQELIEFWGRGIAVHAQNGNRIAVQELSKRLEYWFTMRDALREEMKDDEFDKPLGS
jgi:hypothetical protein